MTDQTTPLRDRIAEALEDAPFRPEERRSLQHADAVLAVLPAPADHAAALREAAAVLDRRASGIDAFSSSDFGEEARAVRELADAANELRRMTDETATTETQPRRGDAFEAWLKAQRDDHPRSSHAWFMVDCVLDRYRLHADTGTPLGEHVCEARVVGDCECLEQPAAGARQDGAQR